MNFESMPELKWSGVPGTAGIIDCDIRVIADLFQQEEMAVRLVTGSGLH